MTIIVVFSGEVVCQVSGAPISPPPEEIFFRDWANQNFIHLSMESWDEKAKTAVDAVIGDSRVVGIGESLHGVKEFLRVRLDMVKHLVEEKDFSVVVLESGFPEALRIHDYVSGAPATDHQYLTGLTWGMGLIKEIREIIEWLRKYNLAHDKKVKFYGLDLAGGNGDLLPTFELLSNLLSPIDTEYVKSLAPLRSILAKLTSRKRGIEAHANDVLENYRRLRNTEKDQLIVFASMTAARIEMLKSYFVGDGKREEDEINKLSLVARSLLQTLHWCKLYDQYKGLTVSSNLARSLRTVRDYAMGENVVQIADYLHRGEKLVVLAHNMHVQKTLSEDYAMAMMGRVLVDHFGDNYKVFATSFDQGSFLKPGGSLFSVGLAPDERLKDMWRLDSVMSQVGKGLDCVLLNLRQPQPATVEGFLAQKMGLRFMPDEKYIDAFLQDVEPAYSFDAIIKFMNISPGTVVLD